MTLNPQEIDHHLDAILRASGSALKNYTMHKTLADMRGAVSALLAAADAKRTSPQPAQAQAVPVELPEPSAHMYPSDLERFASSETFARAYSVAVGCPDERSVPLFTLSKLVDYAKALAATPTPPATNSYAAVTVAAVAEVSKKDGEPALTWLIEGGVYEVPIGSVLLVADRPITDDSGHGEVYTTPPATEQAEGAPERIWLQINPEGDPSDTGYPDDHDGVSWCWHSIGGQEVEYVRADLAQPAHDAGAVDDAERWRILVRLNPAQEFDLSSGPGTPKVVTLNIDVAGCERFNSDGSPDFKATLEAAMDDERGCIAARANGATS